jgi:hypothetical protein
MPCHALLIIEYIEQSELRGLTQRERCAVTPFRYRLVQLVLCCGKEFMLWREFVINRNGTEKVIKVVINTQTQHVWK